MSYDINWKLRVEDTNLWVNMDMPYCDGASYNITYNVGEIIRQSTGLEWKNEEDNGLIKDVIPHIIDGYKELLLNGAKYKHLEPENGWGTVEGTMKFFKNLINAWDSLCNDSWTSDYKNYVHFWIE